MTIHHSISALLRQAADGSPLKTAVAAQKLWNPQKSVMWATCLLLVVSLISASIYCSDSITNLTAQEYSDMSLPSISPSQNHMSPPPAPVNPAAMTLEHSDTSLPGISPSSQERMFSPPPPDPDATKLIDFSVGGCDIWRGDWIPHPDGPAYTNATCTYIQENQNCIKLGRPDLDFLYWRWKPDHCELPLFDAEAFLNIVSGKTLAFIGDSIARNNFQSVLCYLAQIEKPECDDWNTLCYFKTYNFTLAERRAPFLIKGLERAEGFSQQIAKLDLDVLDETWAPTLHNYDYVVLSAARWFVRDSLYFVQNQLVGCNQCPMPNATLEVGWPYAYRAALRTVFDFLISSKYKGVAFFRTLSPDHWQNAPWDQGGNCTQKAPFQSESHGLDDLSQFIYKVQLEEFGKTLKRSSEFAFKLKIVDALHATALRPDAHPGPYGHFHSRVQNDCLHWCLPGAVDTWSAMLLHVLKHL
ncbi:hypothetical protein L7F22_055405 [Adiantum nelumboides]|nr:hypothetical protein [Adiantum nelumboides]